MYDAISENPDSPNVVYPDADAEKAIIDFHACEEKQFWAAQSKAARSYELLLLLFSFRRRPGEHRHVQGAHRQARQDGRGRQGQVRAE